MRYFQWNSGGDKKLSYSINRKHDAGVGASLLLVYKMYVFASFENMMAFYFKLCPHQTHHCAMPFERAKLPSVLEKHVAIHEWYRTRCFSAKRGTGGRTRLFVTSVAVIFLWRHIEVTSLHRGRGFESISTFFVMRSISCNDAHIQTHNLIQIATCILTPTVLFKSVHSNPLFHLR